MPSSLPSEGPVPAPGASVLGAERSLFDPLVLGFALWTLAANAVVFSGGSLLQLAWVAGLTLVLGLVALRVFRQRDSATDSSPLGASPVGEVPGVEVAPWERLFVLGVTLFAMALVLWRQDGLLVWSLGGPLALWCLWRSASGGGFGPSAQPSGRQRLLLSGLALACLGLTLAAHRADFDDAFYINLAVHAADNPREALLIKDSMHGIEGLPLALSVYRIQSFELLAGLLAYLTPLEAIECMHVLFPALISLMIPFGLALALRRLVPTAWLWAVGFGVLFLFAAGEPHRSFGNFSFMRLQQGKSVMLSLCLPLVIHYALRLGAQRDLRSFLLLAAAQVCAIGANVTALWLAPTCALLALAAGLPLRLSSLRVLALGLLSCAYPVVAGLVLSRSTAANLEATGLRVLPESAPPWPALLVPLLVLLVGLLLSARSGAVREGLGKLSALALLAWCLYLGLLQRAPQAEWLASLGVPEAGSERLLESSKQVLGGGGAAALFLFFVLGTWALSPGALARRLWALLGCAFFFIFWNPLAAEIVVAKITGAPTYWRVYWILPAGLLVGAGAASAMDWARRLAPEAGPGRRAAGGLAGLLLVLGLAFLPAHSSLSPKNQVFFASPGLRARKVELQAARALAEQAGSGTQVLAPVRVSPWIPTMHQHPFPLMVRRPYMKNLEGHLDRSDIKERSALTQLVSATRSGPDQSLRGVDLERLMQGIQRYALQGLCLDRRVVGPLLKQALEQEGMRSVSPNKRYQVWFRE